MGSVTELQMTAVLSKMYFDILHKPEMWIFVLGWGYKTQMGLEDLMRYME